MEEWKEYKLSDVCDFNLYQYKQKDNWKNALYLDTGNITKGVIDELQTFDDMSKLPSRAKRMVKHLDIVYSTVRPNQRHFGLLKEPPSNLLVSTGFTVITGREKMVNPYFIYYFLTQNSIIDFLQTLGEQTVSTYPSIKSEDIGNLDIYLPPIKEQNKIASILSYLDDKIELNRRINENLEQQAQALFKSWFIDFEPFQDGEFVDSELGMIPKGWKVGCLSEIGEVVGGGTPSKAKSEYFCKNGIPWITPKDLSNTHAKYTARGEIDITELGYKNSSAKLLPKNSVLFSSRAPIGYISIALNEICTNQGFKSVIPQKAGTAFIYCYLKENIENIERQSTGSTFKEASGALMKSLKVIIPTDNVFRDFENILLPSFHQQAILEQESARLSTLRDTLLPKLMSGEIEIPD